LSFKKVRPAQVKPVTGRELALSKACHGPRTRLEQSVGVKRENPPSDVAEGGFSESQSKKCESECNRPRWRWHPKTGGHHLQRVVYSGKGWEFNSPPWVPRCKPGAGANRCKLWFAVCRWAGLALFPPALLFGEEGPLLTGAEWLFSNWSPAVFSIHSRKCTGNQSICCSTEMELAALISAW